MITVVTDAPIAIDSPDHLMPWGTSRDNSKNKRFNMKFLKLFESLNRAPKVLDLGCSGGGFVKTCLDDGCFAVGIEGSDYSEKHRRAEWPLLGGHFLFTADITHYFSIHESDNPIKFDLITSWEVMEHLPENRLEVTFENMFNSLEDHGLIIVSVSPLEEEVRGVKLHQTVKIKEWWIEKFRKSSLFHMPEYERYFNLQYIRGPKQEAEKSFHLILSKSPVKAPKIPSISLKEKLVDKWYMSKVHRKIAKLTSL